MKLFLPLLAFVSGLICAWLYFEYAKKELNEQVELVKKPLYWVAPMDSNYRRDQPGKSPMGMDLIPVYEDSDQADSSPGRIKISPDVVNNLGVRTVKAQRRNLHNEIRTVGIVQFDEDRLVHIHPRVEGWVEALNIKAAGDPVQKGQPLYALYSPHLVNAQEELLLALNQGSARLVKASEERLKALHFSQSFIQNLKNTKQVSQKVVFFAAQDGVVDKLNIREGYYVQPGTTIMAIGNLDEVWVEAEVFERQASLVEVGLPVTMTLDYLPGRRWTGLVDYVYPTLNSATRTARIRLRFENTDRVLKPNMFAQVVIHANPSEDRLVVPKESVIRTGSQNRLVLALGDGYFKSVAVRLGRAHDEYWEILEGIEEGQEVVSSAQFLLDSESSKTSDFKRLNHGLDQPHSVWAAAQIQQIFVDQRRVTLVHEKVDEWTWPAMTMDLPVNITVPIDQLREGMSLHIEMTRLDDTDVEVSDIHVPEYSLSSQLLDAPNLARVLGEVREINGKERTVTIYRQTIEKWQRPAALVKFNLLQSMDLGLFSVGETIDFTFLVNNGEFKIIKIHRSDRDDTSGRTNSHNAEQSH